LKNQSKVVHFEEGQINKL